MPWRRRPQALPPPWETSREEGLLAMKRLRFKVDPAIRELKLRVQNRRKERMPSLPATAGELRGRGPVRANALRAAGRHRAGGEGARDAGTGPFCAVCAERLRSLAEGRVWRDAAVAQGQPGGRICPAGVRCVRTAVLQAVQQISLDFSSDKHTRKSLSRKRSFLARLRIQATLQDQQKGSVIWENNITLRNPKDNYSPHLRHWAFETSDDHISRYVSSFS